MTSKTPSTGPSSDGLAASRRAARCATSTTSATRCSSSRPTASRRSTASSTDPIPDKGKVFEPALGRSGSRGRGGSSRTMSSRPTFRRARRSRAARRDTLRALDAGQKLRMLPVECVARGYLARLGVEGVPGARDGVRDPSPAGAPGIRRAPGADLHAGDQSRERSRREHLVRRRRRSSSAARPRACASSHARPLPRRPAARRPSKAYLIADTKFEFGYDGTTLTIADEMLTPDSSRFWPAASYRPGGPQASLDKQFVRDYVDRLGWDKRPRRRALPEASSPDSADRYLDIFRRLTRPRGRAVTETRSTG